MFEVETAPTHVATLDKVTRSKMVKLSKPKVAHKRTCVISTCVAQMALLNQKDPRRLKLKLENKANHHIYSCDHCSTLLKMP